MSRINVTNAMREFAAGRTEIYTSLAYTGNALQMARASIPQGITEADVEHLNAFAYYLTNVINLRRAGLDVTQHEQTDTPSSIDGMADIDQHMR